MRILLRELNETFFVCIIYPRSCPDDHGVAECFVEYIINGSGEGRQHVLSLTW
jgi:hypothetical protein